MSEYTFEIQRIRQIFDEGDHEKAFSLCEELLGKYPDSKEFLRQIADMYASEGDVKKSVFYREMLVELGSNEPADFFDLARHAFKLGDFLGSESWGVRCVKACEDFGSDYYLQSAIFLVAYSLLMQRKYSQAKIFNQKLEAGFKFYVPGQEMVSKEQLQEKINKGLDDNNERKTIWKFPE